MRVDLDTSATTPIEVLEHIRAIHASASWSWLALNGKFLDEWEIKTLAKLESYKYTEPMCYDGVVGD